MCNWTFHPKLPVSASDLLSINRYYLKSDMAARGLSGRDFLPAKNRGHSHNIILIGFFSHNVEEFSIS